MRYLSTRGDGSQTLSFEETILTGLAPDGGLYIPATLPSLPSDWQTRWADLPYASLALELISLFVPESEVSRSDLKDIIDRSYATFRAQPDVTPLRELDLGQGKRQWVLELWHGPTFAFKDVALQFLGNLFEYFLKRRNARKGEGEERETLTVVGATSGDTGSAAIYGLRSKADISIFILHPKGRVSPIQEAQMTTVLDDNVYNLAVEGTFDDCQDTVKSLFNDTAFNAQYHLGAVNSINWARICAQIVYYFHSYFAIRRKLGLSASDPTPPIQYAVPTGNFGDILAGYYAKRLGLPSAKMVVATNANDILTRFWRTGRYEKSDSSVSEGQAAQTAVANGSSDGEQRSASSSSGGVQATLSPAMDILVSSNFERLLWHLAYEASGDDIAKAGAAVKEWMDEVKVKGKVAMPARVLELARRDFEAERVSNEETRATIERYFNSASHYVVDPHTAVGLEAASRMAMKNPAGTKQIVLSTAHPAKFSEAVTSSLSSHATFDFERDVLPKEFVGLLDKKRRVIDVRRTGEADGLAAATKDVVAREVGRWRESEAKKRNGETGVGTASV